MPHIFTLTILCMCKGLFRDNPSVSDFMETLEIHIGNPFWELLPKLHFSTGIAEF